MRQQDNNRFLNLGDDKMTNIKKTLSIFLVLILAISLFSFTVFASNEVNSPEIDPDTPQVEPVDPVQPTDPQPQEYEQEIIDYGSVVSETVYE